MYNILIAPDSFKGTLSASEVCDIIGQAFEDTIKNIKITKLPAADGGEGLCSCLHKILGGELKEASVRGVFGEKTQAEYLMLADNTAVIEMAACAGLPLAGERKDPEKTVTFGVGELMLDARANGAKSVLLGIGGSATNDFGIGMASALGWKFTDENGAEVYPCGGNLGKIASITPPPNCFDLPVTVACDVENPLYGENGAAYVFAPQKGANEDAVRRLDEGLQSISRTVKKCLGIDVSAIKGSGAAGGMGGGAVAFLGAKLKKGIDIILDEADFEKKALEADLIITGEGRLDSQSVNGKVISGIAQRASALGKKVVAVCGSKGDGAEEIRKLGVDELYFASEEPKPFDEIIRTCRADLYNAALRAAKEILTEGENNGK